MSLHGFPIPVQELLSGRLLQPFERFRGRLWIEPTADTVSAADTTLTIPKRVLTVVSMVQVDYGQGPLAVGRFEGESDSFCVAELGTEVAKATELGSDTDGIRVKIRDALLAWPVVDLRLKMLGRVSIARAPFRRVSPFL